MPLPLGADRLLTVPSLALMRMSLAVKLLPGASLKLRVSVTLWPDRTLGALLVIARVGASVSMVI